jgi:plasmid maintenance system antidote protein VapI
MPSEPKTNPSSTEERGFRVRVVYPILFEYRYVVYPNARDWRVAERPKATVFLFEDEANEVVQVVNDDPDIKAVGGRAALEPIPSFDPDWCISPGVQMSERMKQLGITPEQLTKTIGTWAPAILAGSAPYSEDVAQKLSALLGGEASYWMNLNNNYQEGLRRGLHVTK